MVNLDHRDVQKVAALFCEGMERTEIARILSKDENEIQRMIEAAEQMKFFEYRPCLKRIDPEVRDFVYNETLTFSLSAALKEKMELTLVPVTITPSPKSMFTAFEINTELHTEPYENYSKAERESLEIVSSRAAQELSKVLFNGENHIVGLNWGLVVKKTIAQIHPLPSQLSRAKISVVSLFGDLEFQSPDPNQPLLDFSVVNCNHLVAQLAQQLGGHGEAVPLNVPGFIPVQFSRNNETFNAIRGFMSSHASYQRIFGNLPSDHPTHFRDISGILKRPTEAIIARMDTIITGFGSADVYTVLGRYLTSWLDSDEIANLQHYHQADQVIGDLGGHLVASHKAREDAALDNFLHKVNRRLLAAQPSDFVDVASRHRHTQKGGGVIGISLGARKAHILYTLLSWTPCPISQLIIDTHCALALLNLVDPEALRHFSTTEPGKCLLEGKGEWSEGTRRLIPV